MFSMVSFQQREHKGRSMHRVSYLPQPQSSPPSCYGALKMLSLLRCFWTKLATGTITTGKGLGLEIRQHVRTCAVSHNSAEKWLALNAMHVLIYKKYPRQKTIRFSLVQTRLLQKGRTFWETSWAQHIQETRELKLLMSGVFPGRFTMYS